MKYRSNSILALIPQSDEGERLLQQVFFFQRSLQMRVFLLNIIHPIGWFTRSFQPKKAVKIKMDAKEELKDFAAKAFQNNIPDDYILRVQVGKKVPVLVNESQKGGYEFIVIDKSCGNYPGSFCKNEVDKFINRSFCPVLTINKDFQVDEIKKIIVPIDISQPTKKRLYWATYFAKKYNAKIQIVSALNAGISETKSLAYKNAEDIRTMLTGRGVVCEVVILKVQQQKSHKVILNYIGEQNPDMIIIRTHQESMFAEGRIGKFVSGIVHGCKMPVFVVGQSTLSLPADFE